MGRRNVHVRVFALLVIFAGSVSPASAAFLLTPNGNPTGATSAYSSGYPVVYWDSHGRSSNGLGSYSGQ